MWGEIVIVESFVAKGKHDRASAVVRRICRVQRRNGGIQGFEIRERFDLGGTMFGLDETDWLRCTGDGVVMWKGFMRKESSLCQGQAVHRTLREI